MDIEDIRAFAWIAASGSLSRTARDFALPKATLSYRLRRLEAELGTPLLSRSGSGLTLTPAGQAFLLHAQEVEHACRRAHDAVAGQLQSQGIRLRIGASDELGTNLLAPLSLQFSRQHPSIALDLLVMPTSRLFLDESGLDCMICAGLPATENGPSLVARGFSRYFSRLYASPGYLARRGTPSDPDDLGGHDLIRNTAAIGSASWSLIYGQRNVVVEPRGPLQTNDNWIAKVCALQDRGIALFPEFFAQEHVDGGDLVQVLPEWHTAPTSLTVLHHAHRFANPYIRGFIDFLTSQFSGLYHFPYRESDILQSHQRPVA